MKPKLTAVQENALRVLREHGCLVRHPGGYWTSEAESSATKERGHTSPEWSFGTNTITGLIAKGYARGTRFMRRGEPWAVEPITQDTPAGAVAS